MIEMKYYDITTLNSSEEIKSVLIESIAILKQNALLTNFHDVNARKKYSEQVKNVQKYYTALELMLDGK